MKIGTVGLWLLAGMFLAIRGSGEEAVSQLNVTNSRSAAFPFRQLRPGVFAIGQVILHKKEGAISFPARVNQREGTVEYTLVTDTGKTHESIFRTGVAPEPIHIALLLLGAKPAQTNRFPENLSVPPPGEPVMITVAWTNHGASIVRPMEDFVLTTNNMKTLSRGPWVYNGSYVDEGGFVAQREGSIISVQIDPDALINDPRPGRENDDLHLVNTAALPPDDTPIEIRIKLVRTRESSGQTSSLAR